MATDWEKGQCIGRFQQMGWRPKTRLLIMKQVTPKKRPKNYWHYESKMTTVINNSCYCVVLLYLR